MEGAELLPCLFCNGLGLLGRASRMVGLLDTGEGVCVVDVTLSRAALLSICLPAAPTGDVDLQRKTPRNHQTC